MLPVKVIIFDIDDTLWHSVDDERAINRFEVLDERRVADQPGIAQELVENAREVLLRLHDKGYILTCGTMGPRDQVESFMRAFGIFEYFNNDIALFDRIDKDEKVKFTIEAASRFMDLSPADVLFVDDNMGYLATVNKRFPDVKCIWAHYYASPGLEMLNEDVQECFGFTLW